MSGKVDYQLRRKVWIGIFLGLLVFWGTIATIVTLALALRQKFLLLFSISPSGTRKICFVLSAKGENLNLDGNSLSFPGPVANNLRKFCSAEALCCGFRPLYFLSF